MTAVSLREVSVRFGGVTALDRVDLDVPTGARHVIFGPNGAGKTTLFRVISGELRPSSGEVMLDGATMTTAPPRIRARAGIGRTFQTTTLFDDLSVRDNIALSVQADRPERRVAWTHRRRVTSVQERVEEVLVAEELDHLAERPAGSLAYGDQRLLELAVVIAARPRTLLLDEPTAGMAAGDIPRVIGRLQALPDHTTVVLVEHNLEVAFALSTTATVMANGALITSGPVDTVRSDPRVRAVYLGDGVTS